MPSDSAEFFEGMEVIDAEGAPAGTLVRHDQRLGIAPDRIRLNITKDVVTASGIHLSVAKDDITMRYMIVPEVVKDFFAR